jgi:hypothetical protein
MSIEAPRVDLYLEPEQIPALRAVIEESLAELTNQLDLLEVEGRIDEPWLGDQASAAVAAQYNVRVMESDDGPYAALRAYEKELGRIRDNLKQMEDDYRRNEAGVADGLNGIYS